MGDILYARVEELKSSFDEFNERLNRLERWREEMPDGDTMKALGRVVIELTSRNDSLMKELEAEHNRERMAKLVKDESK